MENPTHEQIEEFLQNVCIGEDYFYKIEQYTQLKHKITACMAGVFLNIPLRRDNTPGTKLSNWFNVLAEEEKKKVISDEIFVLNRELISRTNNIQEEETSLESKEAGERKNKNGRKKSNEAYLPKKQIS